LDLLELSDSYCQTDSCNGFPDYKLVEKELKVDIKKTFQKKVVIYIQGVSSKIIRKTSRFLR